MLPFNFGKKFFCEIKICQKIFERFSEIIMLIQLCKNQWEKKHTKKKKTFRIFIYKKIFKNINELPNSIIFNSIENDINKMPIRIILFQYLRIN